MGMETLNLYNLGSTVQPMPSASECPANQFLNGENVCVNCGECKNGEPCDQLTGRCPGNECRDFFYPSPECRLFVTGSLYFIFLEQFQVVLAAISR